MRSCVQKFLQTQIPCCSNYWHIYVFIVWHICICKCHVVYMLEHKGVYMPWSNYRNYEILTCKNVSIS